MLYPVAPRKRHARARAREKCYARVHTRYLPFSRTDVSSRNASKPRERVRRIARDTRRNVRMHTRARAYANTRDIFAREREREGGGGGREREKRLTFILHFAKSDPIDKNLPLSVSRVLFFRIVQFTISLPLPPSFVLFFLIINDGDILSLFCLLVLPGLASDRRSRRSIECARMADRNFRRHAIMQCD